MSLSSPVDTVFDEVMEEHSHDVMFEDELMPAATPEAAAPPPPPTSTFNTNQYDPFAPQHAAPEAFEDEVVLVNTDLSDKPSALASVSSTALDLLRGAASTSGTASAPVLIPNHPDADADLLGGAISKKASKVSKDAKITDITYQDGDVENGNNNLISFKNPPSVQESTDTFVDDEAGGATAGGLFSRFRGAASTPGTASAPVLIPSHPDADTDLLGGVIPKKASKISKDPKITDITYQDGDVKNGNNNLINFENPPNVQKSNDTFVDDEAGGATAGGLFSRLRNKIPLGSSAGAASNSNSNTATAINPPATMDALEDGGNSLPHPATLMLGSSRDFLDESTKESSESVGLNENGNSLPHPDEVLRSSGIVDGDRDVEGDDVLGANGNSLPHPETLMRDDDRVPLNDTATTRINLSYSGEDECMGINSNGSMDSGDRLMAGLDAAVGDTDTDEYIDNDTEDDSDTDTDEESTKGNDLDTNGNSLPHPDTMMLEGSDHGIPSFRWGSFRMSLRSTFKKSKKEGGDPDDHISEDDEDGDEFHEEEGRTSNDMDLLYLNNDGTVDENRKSLPAPGTGGRSLTSSALPGRLQSMGRSMMSTLFPWSSLHSKAATPEDDVEQQHVDPFMRDDDEVYAFGGDDQSSSLPYRSDNFADESNRELTQKERLQNMLREHRNNPRSRKICIAFVIFLLFLCLVIPLGRNATKRRQNAKKIESERAATLSPTFSGDTDCDDEIVLTDQYGEDLVDDVSESWSAASIGVACYTTLEPVYFRFKRCRPASPMDWIGVYPVGSNFMDRLWKEYHDGVYLCGGQPCPIDDPMNQSGGPPLSAAVKTPPIVTPGEYRVFLVKDSSWPFEYLQHTPSFLVVEDKASCSFNDTLPVNVPDVLSNNSRYNPSKDATNDSGATIAPTASGTVSGTFSGTVSGTSGGTGSGTVSGTVTSSVTATDMIVV